MKKTVFIFKNDEIGDFCLWLPFANRLKKLYPNYKIILGVKKELKEFAENFSYFDEIKTIKSKSGLYGLFFCIFSNLSIIFRKYDLVLNAVPGPKCTDNMIIVFFMYAKQKKIFYIQDFLKNIPYKYTLRFFLMRKNIYHSPWHSIFDFNNTILNTITENIDKVFMKESFEHIAEKGNGLFIVFAIGSSSLQRNWPIKNFIFITKQILQKYPDIRILLAGTKTEWNSAEKIFQCQKQQITNLCGKTSLNEIISYQKKALFTLSNETSLAHTSALLRKKTFILAGCGHLGWFVPYPKEYTHVKTFYKDCKYKNCNWICHYKKRESTFPCIQSISPKSVWLEIEKYLNSTLEKK